VSFWDARNSLEILPFDQNFEPAASWIQLKVVHQWKEELVQKHFEEDNQEVIPTHTFP
jgi:hypothetical protein